MQGGNGGTFRFIVYRTVYNMSSVVGWKEVGRFGSYAKGQRIFSLAFGLDIKVSDLIN